MPYLTPDDPPDDTVCFTLQVPNDITWIGIVKGAISELIKSYNFEEFGTFSPIDTAARFLQMYEDFVFSECDMACCYDLVEHRVTSDGQMQIRINGGDWIPDPNDPRQTGIALPPPVMDETHTKCDAATNGKQHIMDYIASVSSQLGAVGSVVELAFAIAALIVALLFGQVEAIPVIAPLILALIPSLIALGQAAWDAYWDSAAEDIILCALYCNIGDDGTFDQAGFDAFLAKLAADLTPGVAADNLITQLRAAGLVALNNMCSYGESAEADCSSCACGCVAGWADGLTTPDQVSVDGDFIVLQVNEDGGDGHFYGQATRANSSDCCVCVDGSFDSGGSGFQAQIKECGSEDFSFPLFTGGGVNCWKVQIRCNEVSVYRFKPT